MKNRYQFINLNYFIFATSIDEKFYLVALICIFLITREHHFTLLLNIKNFLLILLVHTLYASFCCLSFSYSFVVPYMLCILILFYFLCFRYVLSVCHLLFNFENFIMLSFILDVS